MRETADSIWLCPSRGRPGQVAELREAWDKVTSPQAALLVAVDADDPELDAYLADGPVRVIPPLGWLGPILNRLAPGYAPRYGHIGFLGDDHRPRTPGWDRQLAGALHGRPGVAYGNDLIKSGEVATAALISSRVITALGYMVPPGDEATGRPPVLHMDTDTFWTQLGRDLGCLEYLDHVIIEHMHPLAGKGIQDAGYHRVNTPERHYADRMAYQRFLAERWYGPEGDLARLREKLDG